MQGLVTLVLLAPVITGQDPLDPCIPLRWSSATRHDRLWPSCTPVQHNCNTVNSWITPIETFNIWLHTIYRGAAVEELQNNPALANLYAHGLRAYAMDPQVLRGFDRVNFKAKPKTHVGCNGLAASMEETHRVRVAWFEDPETKGTGYGTALAVAACGILRHRQSTGYRTTMAPAEELP